MSPEGFGIAVLFVVVAVARSGWLALCKAARRVLGRLKSGTWKAL